MVELDCKALNCPMPIVRLSQAIQKLDSGQSIRVSATDPAFEPDVRAWSERLGHPIVSFETVDGVHFAVLQKT